MITTATMRQLIALVLKEDADKVTQALLQAGVIHFIDISEIPSEWVSHLDSPADLPDGERIQDLRRRLEAYFDITDFVQTWSAEGEKINIRKLNLKAAEEQLVEFGSRIRKVREQQRQVRMRFCGWMS